MCNCFHRRSGFIFPGPVSAGFHTAPSRPSAIPQTPGKHISPTLNVCRRPKQLADGLKRPCQVISAAGLPATPPRNNVPTDSSTTTSFKHSEPQGSSLFRWFRREEGGRRPHLPRRSTTWKRSVLQTSLRRLHVLPGTPPPVKRTFRWSPAAAWSFRGEVQSDSAHLSDHLIIC